MVHRNTKLYAILSLAVLTVAVVAYVGMLYVVNIHQATFQERLSELAREEARRDALMTLARTAENSAEERAELMSHVLTEAQVIDLLSLIETLGRERGITLTTDSLTTIQSTNAFEGLTIRLSATGRYDRIMHVLKMLESLPYQSMVQSVSLSSGAYEGGGTWEAKIELVVTKVKQI